MKSKREEAIAEQLVTAKYLISQRYLDTKATLAMLKALPNDISEDAQASVKEALKDVRAAAKGNSSYEAFARYALARVITMLERYTRASAATSKVLAFRQLETHVGRK